MNNNSNDKTNNKPIVNFKTETDGLEVEFDVIPIYDSSNADSMRQAINAQLLDIDEKLASNQEIFDKLSADIDKLTSHTDGWDYTVAAISGVLSGLIDSFLVGELDLKVCHEYGNNKVEKIIKKMGKNEDLEKAIKNLENKTKNYFPSDSNMNDLGGSRQHHLRDFAHHPTLIGLLCSLLTQFTGYCYGTNTAGQFIAVEVNDKSRIGDTVPKKIIYGTLYWFIHLASDMAGSSGCAGGGTGIPGPLLSLAKELSVLPCFSKMNKKGNKEISVFISKLFNGTLFAQKDASGKLIKDTVIPIDLRTEIGIIHEQTLPIIINECLVRTFYSVKRLVIEIKEKSIASVHDFIKLDWGKINPIGNRTIERMMTIATATFTVVDVADAAIRSGGFKNPQILLRINYVGIGRFVIAIGVDTAMGITRSKLRNKRIAVCCEQLYLLNAKTYYKQANMWQSAKNAEEAIKEMQEMMAEATYYFNTAFQDIDNDMKKINKYIPLIENKNPGLLDDIDDILNWG